MSHPPGRRRAGWIVAVVSLGLVSLGLAAMRAGSPAAPVAPLCADSAQEVERARQLVQQGLEQALVEHTQHLFLTWLRGDVEESGRAGTGVRNGLRAFFHARHQIEALDIPPCKVRKS